MRSILVVLITIAVVGFSCKKEEEPGIPFDEQLSLDSAAIANYLEANSITNVLKDETGYVSYVLHEEGTGLPPILTDSIEVSYIGTLMDNSQEFDSGDHVEFRLNGLIAGWQFVLTEMHEGDSVTMYIPSGYAYGPSGTTGIPANANLIFGMKLHRVFQ